MKNLLFLLISGAMLFAACEKTDSPKKDEPKPNQDPVLTLTSNGAMVFEYDGGAGEITYTLEYPQESLQIDAEPNVSWIIYVDTNKIGKVSFQVTGNPGVDPRSGEIRVTYGTEQFTVAINQKGYEKGVDKTVELPNVCGIYYGNRDGGDYNYYFMITDGTMNFRESNGDYDLYDYNSPNATYYFVDLFVKNPDNGSLMIPNGTYPIDMYNSGRGDKFMEGFSKYQINDESGFSKKQWGFSDGELVVEDGKMTLTVTLYDSVNEMDIETHCVIFNGTYEPLVDNSL